MTKPDFAIHREDFRLCGPDSRASDTFTRKFEKRLVYSVATNSIRDGTLIELVDLSRECIVASSPLLKDNMVWVNRQLVRPGAFSATCLLTRDVVLKETILGPEQLTPTPVGKPRQLSLGEDGIIVPGMIVQPGDILVGIEVPKSRHLTGEEELLQSIFGRSDEKTKDGSLVYDSPVPGQVVSVRVSLSKKWGISESQPKIEQTAGKHVVHDASMDLRSRELAKVSITLAVEQRLEVGDTLFGEGGSHGVVCRISSGVVLKETLNLPIEPDLVVGTKHAWVPPAGGSPVHTVLVGPRGDSLLGQETCSRATGGYSISQRPLASEWIQQHAQELKMAHFRWLLDHDARHLALELYGPRCDCVEWRTKLYEMIVKGERRLTDLDLHSLAQWQSPIDAPGAKIHYWSCLLHGACIRPLFDQGRLLFQLANDNDVRHWSFGEVKQPETINCHTYRTERDGLFCEHIFGPEKDWECACGKYRGMKYKGMICDHCGVMVTHSRVRYKRMGHIELATPVVHPWLFLRCENILGKLLGMEAESLEKIIYYRSWVVTSSGESPLPVGQLLDEKERVAANRDYLGAGLQTNIGAVAIEILLHKRKAEIGDTASPKIILRCIPVIPPGLRPMVLLDSGTFATSDLNDLYRRIINRSNRLRKLSDLNAPERIINNEARMLQQCLDALLDNERLPKPVLDGGHRPLKSIAGRLQDISTKPGTLREGILWRPVDYSAQTRLAVDYTPDVDTCFLPQEFAWDIFQPLIISRLKATGVADTIKSAYNEIKRRTDAAVSAMKAVAAEAIILTAFSFGPWPLAALRVQCVTNLGLSVHPDLMEQIGWDNLGKRVNVFSVLTREAESEAMARLLPSCLVSANSQLARKVDDSSSPFDVTREEMIDRLVAWSYQEQSFPVSLDDYLLFGAKEALISLDAPAPYLR